METSHHFSAIAPRACDDDNGVIFVHRTKDKLLAFAQTNFFVMYVSGQFRLKCQLEKNIVHDTPYYLTCRALIHRVKCMKLKRRFAVAHHQKDYLLEVEDFLYKNQWFKARFYRNAFQAHNTKIIFKRINNSLLLLPPSNFQMQPLE